VISTARDCENEPWAKLWMQAERTSVRYRTKDRCINHARVDERTDRARVSNSRDDGFERGEGTNYRLTISRSTE